MSRRWGESMGATPEWDQPEVCDRCGGKAFRPATRRERLTGWFTYGAGASVGWYCRNCGVARVGGSGFAVLHDVPRGHRRARLPLGLLQALRGARRWHPVPRFYAIVGAVGLVPALAVALLTRVRWWVPLGVPVVAMVGAFLWSLVSAGGRGCREVLREVLAPDRAWREDLEEELTGMREQIGDFRLLVPDGWAGELSIQGASWSIPPRGPRVLRELTVVADQGDPLLDLDRHAPDWRPPTPCVEIRCTRDAWASPEEVALREFVDRAFPPSPPDLDGLEQRGQGEVERRMLEAHWRHQRERQRREAEWADLWHDGSVLVDGVAVPARQLMQVDAGVAVVTFDLDGQPVMVVAEGMALGSLRLVGVADPIPLLDELETRRRRVFAQTTDGPRA
ncbi:MAG: hypothetical protein ACR2HR_15675 [Euzebya sp.]